MLSVIRGCGSKTVRPVRHMSRASGGRVEPKTGTLDLPLIVDWPNRPHQMVCHETGKPAITDWRVIKYEGETTHIRLFPKTGRSHQLRVHMQALGHPVLDDPFYAEGAARDFHRLMPHSEELRLERVGFGRIDVFTRQVEAAFAKHNAFNLSGEFNLTRHALKNPEGGS